LLATAAGAAALALGLFSVALWLRAGAAAIIAAVLTMAAWFWLLNQADRSQVLNLIRPATVK
jgi:hypothetical protein